MSITIDGITAAVGLNGSGKTLCIMDQVVAPSIALGRPILSNTPIFASGDDAHLPWEERRPHPLYVPLLSWRQLSAQRLDGCTIFLDEISSMFDSMETAKMPAQVRTSFQQLRKDDNCIAWTAPDWDRCDKTLRRVTTAVWSCSGHRKRTVEGKVWRQSTLVKWRFYNAAKFEEFSQAQAQSERKGTIRPEFRRRRRVASVGARLLYDTFAPVNLLDHLDQYGVCVGCGGTSRRPKCECPPASNAGKVRPLATLADMKAYARDLLAERDPDAPVPTHLLEEVGEHSPTTEDAQMGPLP